MSKSTKRSHELQRVITAKDNIIADVRNKLDDAVASNRQMEEMLKLKNNELERMAHDLNAVTRESQVVSIVSYIHKKKISCTVYVFNIIMTIR